MANSRAVTGIAVQHYPALRPPVQPNLPIDSR